MTVMLLKFAVFIFVNITSHLVSMLHYEMRFFFNWSVYWCKHLIKLLSKYLIQFNELPIWCELLNICVKWIIISALFYGMLRCRYSVQQAHTCFLHTLTLKHQFSKGSFVMFCSKCTWHLALMVVNVSFMYWYFCDWLWCCVLESGIVPLNLCLVRLLLCEFLLLRYNREL